MFLLLTDLGFLIFFVLLNTFKKYPRVPSIVITVQFPFLHEAFLMF